MTEQQNTEIAQAAYDNFKTGNIEALLNLVSDDVIWTVPKADNVPFTGNRTGRAEVAEFFSILNNSQEPLEFEPQTFIGQGEKVAVQGRYLWQTKTTGRKYECDWMHVFTIRDGKIVGFQEYTDTAAAAKAYERALSA
jgi:ketosteroid isomerase-like protein